MSFWLIQNPRSKIQEKITNLLRLFAAIP